MTSTRGYAAMAGSLAQLGVAGDGPEPLASEVRSKVLQRREVIRRAGRKVDRAPCGAAQARPLRAKHETHTP
jgi:hypothetical protein